jgi:hypothetical protein
LVTLVVDAVYNFSCIAKRIRPLYSAYINHNARPTARNQRKKNGDTMHTTATAAQLTQAATLLEAYTEAVRPKQAPSPNAQFSSIADLAEANRAAGGHWFDPESKRFFRSRIAPGLYRGQRLIWFVSSEKSGWEDSSPRKFTVRVFDPTDAGVDSVGELFAHRDLSSARAAARSLAKRDLAGEHVKPAAQGDQCGFCGHYGRGCTGTARATVAA